MTQERRQEERRRRRLAGQQQRRDSRPQRTDGPIGAVQFTGPMGWMQQNARWLLLLVAVLFIGSLGAAAFVRPTTPTPAPTPSATATTPAAAATAAGTATPDASIQRAYATAPPFTINPTKAYTAVIKLQRGGEVRLQLLPESAPQSVNNFVFLAQNHFYDGLTFHRVLPGFVAQGGDPQGTGFGGPGYMIPSDKNTEPFDAGVISMAKSSAGISGSQFFITLAPTPSLQSGFAVFGRVTDGMDVVQQITLRDPTKANQPPADVISSIEIIEGN